MAPRLHLDGVVESKAFHICPFCRAPSPVSEQRCARCGRSLAGLPLETYGFETDAALAHPLPKPLMDLPLREQEAAGNDGAAPAPALPLRPALAARRRPGPAAMRRPPRDPLPGAIVGMAVALAAAIAAGATLVRPRRPAPAVRTAAAREILRRQASAHIPVSRESAALATPPPVIARATAPSPVVTVPPPAGRPRPEIHTLHPDLRPDRDDVRDDEVSAPDEDALVLRAQLRRAEESRDRLADRVDRLRARMDVPVVTDVDRYQRLQDELETAREDLDRAEAEVARWRRALRRVG